MEGALGSMISTFAREGKVRWIGVRSERKGAVHPVENAHVEATGLAGDHRNTPGKRAVTFVQWEHLAVIAALSGNSKVAPERLRRNIAVSGINLLGLRKARFKIGSALFQGTGPCAPCSRMEDELGRGGFNAVRGHGGITAEVIDPGEIKLGDAVMPCDTAGGTG